MFRLIETGTDAEISTKLNEIGLLTTARRKNQIEETKEGKTLIHAAVARGSLPILKALIHVMNDLKINFNKADSAGNTPLHDAVEKGSLPLVRELVANDVDMKVVNNQNKSATQLAEIKSLLDDANPEMLMIAALLRTRLAWQEASVGFRFNRVVGLIEASFPSIKLGGGTDKLLCIGGTGAGKSTFLNYMNGTQYHLGMTPAGKPYAKAKGGNAEIANVGQGMTSQTLYPQVIIKNGLNYSYCDLAGLFDNRGNAERICAASSVQILSRLPGSIKGILLVLDIPSFIANRGEAFKGTAVALSHMVKSNPDLMDSVYYIITKIPQACRDESGNLVTTSEDIIESYVEPLLMTLSGDGALDSKDTALKFMLEQMTMHTDNILTPDITDNGKSRKELELRLSAVQGKKANLYNFVSHDGAQKAFNDTLEGIAESFLENNRMLDDSNKMGLPEQINIAMAKHAELAQQISQWENEISERKMSGNNYDPAAVDIAIKEKNDLIGVNDNTIAQKNTAIISLQGKIAMAKAEISTLDTDEMIHVGDTKYDISGRPGAHHLRYQSRFPCYGPDSVGGFFWGYGELSSRLMPECNAMSGLYSAMLFASNGLSRVDVNFNTQKKYIHAARIKELRLHIYNWSNEIRGNQCDINKLTAQNKQLREEIIACEREKIQGAADSEIIKIRLKAEIDAREGWVTNAKADLEEILKLIKQLQQNKLNLEFDLLVNQDLFETVYRISHILDLGSSKNIATFWQKLESITPGVKAGYDAWMKQMTGEKQPNPLPSTLNDDKVNGVFNGRLFSHNPATVDKKVANKSNNPTKK